MTRLSKKKKQAKKALPSVVVGKIRTALDEFTDEEGMGFYLAEDIREEMDEAADLLRVVEKDLARAGL